MVNTSATRKRLRMSRAIASIDMPAWPPWPWPWASSARSHRGVVVRRPLGAGLDERVADVAGDRLAGAVIAALLDPAAQLLDRRLRGVEGHRRGLRDRVGLDGEHARPVPEHLLDDRLLGSRSAGRRRAGPWSPGPERSRCSLHSRSLTL